MPMTSYTELVPPPHLRDHVACFWQRAAGDGPVETRVLPDGCIDIIWIAEGSPFVAGPMTASVLHVSAPATPVTGVRFRPGVAPFLLGVSARDLLNQNVSLRDIFPGSRHQPWDDAIPRDTGAAALPAIVEAAAAAVFAMGEHDVFVTRAAGWLARHPSARMADLARRSALSERQMRRRFDDAVGYGPKTLQRIMRLQRLLWLAGQEQAGMRSLGGLSLAAGYADQPHMTREVATLTGASPSMLLQHADPRSAVADLFKTVAT